MTKHCKRPAYLNQKKSGFPFYSTIAMCLYNNIIKPFFNNSPVNQPAMNKINKIFEQNFNIQLINNLQLN